MPATLTPQGKLRIENFISLLRVRMPATVEKIADTLKAKAAENAPSESQEARLLSAGVAQDGPRAGQTVGTPDGGRFFRMGSMLSMRAAIKASPNQVITTESKFTVRTASASWINQRTGFYWFTKRRGLQGPTLPFNRNYLQALEYGGAVWVVRPRLAGINLNNLNAIMKVMMGGGPLGLHPEDGVFTSSMIKTMPPYRMFKAAVGGSGLRGRLIFNTQLSNAARAAAREVWRR